jgi:hypothetical protein
MYYTKIEEAQAAAMSVKFIINNGGKWDETTSRMHCCDAVYRDARYIQRTIRKWACSQKEAYHAAVAAWLEEKEAGRAL